MNAPEMFEILKFNWKPKPFSGIVCSVSSVPYLFPGCQEIAGKPDQMLDQWSVLFLPPERHNITGNPIYVTI